VPKSIFEIDVQDAKFKAFLKLFADYQDQLGKMSGFWGEAGKAADSAATATGGMEGSLAAAAASTMLIVDALKKSDDHAVRTDSTLKSMASHAKSIADHLLHATISLAKWSALSLGAGLIGAGGSLYGLDALANTVSGQRKAALGLGITAGENLAFGVNYGSRLVGNDFLSTVQGVRADLSQQWMFSALGIPAGEMQRADTAQLGIDVIGRARALWQQAGHGGHNQQWMEAHGLGGFMDYATWQRIGQASPADLAKYEQQYRRDVGSMGANDATQTAWQDFAIQMKRAGEQIESVLVKGLVGLSGPLGDLSASIEKALAGFLGNPHMKEWIDDFGKGIEHLASYLGSKEFQSDIKTFADDVAYAVRKLVGVMQWLGLLPDPEAVPPPALVPPPPGTPIPGIFPEGSPTLRLPPYSGRPVNLSEIDQRWGLPQGLTRAVGIQESGLNPNVPDSNPLDAQGRPRGGPYQGPFQMSREMQALTGVTNPSSIEQEAPAFGVVMANYIQQYHGNVAEALAAWNWGPAAVDKDIAAHGQRWLDYAPPETQKFVRDIASQMHVTITVMNQTGANVAMLTHAAGAQ
jgi:hypothetical protein